MPRSKQKPDAPRTILADSTGKIPTQEEELELIAKAQAGDRRAEDRLLRSYIRWVVKLVRLQLYKNPPHLQVSLEDATQAGMIGLTKAIHQFKDRGYKLSTYSRWKIMTEVQMACNKHNRCTTALDKILMTEAGRIQRLFGPLSVLTVKKYIKTKGTADAKRILHDPPEAVNQRIQNAIDKTIARRTASLDSSRLPGNDAASDSPDYDASLHNILASNEPNAEQQLSRHESLAKMREVLDVLTPRERYILLQRAEGEILDTIAKHFGLCGERIRQIEKKATNKLKWAIEIRGLTYDDLT